MTNLSKTFDDSFKKEVIDLIKQGLKKELPTGAVYSASKKPPEGAREFTTDRGTKYWIPSKKDKEDSKAKQAKPKAPRTQRGAMAYDGPNKERSEAADRVKAKTKARREEAAKSKASSTPKTGSEPFKADGKPKMGKKSFTEKQRKELGKKSHNVYMKELGEPEKNMYHALYQELEGNPMANNKYTQLIEKLTKKMKNGTYDGNEAEKLAATLLDDTSKWRFYALGDKPKNEDISPKVKSSVAKYWAREFESNYANGSFDEREPVESSLYPNTD